VYHGNRHRIAGDFLGIGKLIKTGVRVIGGAVLGGITGGPGGAIAGALAGTRAATAANARTEILNAGGGGSAYTPALRARHAAAVATHAGHALSPGVSAAGTPMVSLAAGGAGGGGGGGGGRRRRMNPYNPRALRRANRRMTSFLHHAKKFLGFYHSGAHQGKVVKFKKARHHK
jgi:hypothetical protein